MAHIRTHREVDHAIGAEIRFDLNPEMVRFFDPKTENALTTGGAGMSQITLQNITKRFGAITALNDVSFEVRDAEFFVLLGPTGAGQDHHAARDRRPDKAGHRERDVSTGNPSIRCRRPTGTLRLCSSSTRCIPTMTVYDNLAFPLRSPLRKLREPEIKKLE